MILVVDTCGLISCMDTSSQYHARSLAALDQSLRPVLSPLVIAETDYILRDRVGSIEADSFLEDIGNGVFEIPMITPQIVKSAAEVHNRYLSLDLGITDATQVVLAGDFDTGDLLTLDSRDFRPIAPLSSHDSFTLHPLDSPGV